MGIKRFKDMIGNVKQKIKGSFRGEKMKRSIVVVASLGIIGGAVYLNWSYFNPSDSKANKDIDVSTELVDIEEAESYFAMTEVSRQRTRDEALEVLQTIVDTEATSQEDRDAALNAINVIASNIQSEGNIESLVVSKGFEDCVAVISEGNATVVVKSDGLLENEVTQIQEIVYTEAGILPENLKIIEKSS